MIKKAPSPTVVGAFVICGLILIAVAIGVWGSGTLFQEALQNANPGQPIDLLVASGTAKVVGKEDVNGVQATHYTGTITLDQLSGKLGKDLRDMIRKQFAKGGAKSEQLDVWIDSVVVTSDPSKLRSNNTESCKPSSMPNSSTLLSATSAINTWIITCGGCESIRRPSATSSRSCRPRTSSPRSAW